MSLRQSVCPVFYNINAVAINSQYTDAASVRFGPSEIRAECHVLKKINAVGSVRYDTIRDAILT